MCLREKEWRGKALTWSLLVKMTDPLDVFAEAALWLWHYAAERQAIVSIPLAAVALHQVECENARVACTGFTRWISQQSRLIYRSPLYSMPNNQNVMCSRKSLVISWKLYFYTERNYDWQPKKLIVASQSILVCLRWRIHNYSVLELQKTGTGI